MTPTAVLSPEAPRTASGPNRVKARRGAVNQRFFFPEISRLPQPGLRGIAIINTGLPYLQGITAATRDEGSWILTS
jgi:hypothetical protein